MNNSLGSLILDYLIIDNKKYDFLDYKNIKKKKKITMNIILRGTENEV